MPNLTGPMTDLYYQQLEASRRFADAVFLGAEKIDRILIEATHHAFTEQVNLAQAIAEARDPQGVATVQREYLLKRPDGSVNYQREIIQTFTEIQNELGQSMQEYMEQFGAAVADSANGALRQAQQQTGGRSAENVPNPVTGMISIWESAFREFTSFANRNMEIARSTFDDATGQALNATRDMADAASTDAASAVDAYNEAVDAASEGSTRRSSSQAGHHQKKSRPSSSRRR